MPTSSPILAAARGALLGSLLTLRVETVPSPSHRPQVGKFGTYYAKGYQACMADCIKQLAQQRPAVTLTGARLVALVETFCPRPKSTKFLDPRGDWDNYAKAPMDACTKVGIFGDDVQVKVGLCEKFWTEPGQSPGYIITIGEYPSCP